MQDVIDYAQRQGIASVRLVQEAFNAKSLSLYAKLGFDVKDELAFMQAAPGTTADNSVRAATEGDVDAMDELSVRLYRTSRRNEVAAAIRSGFSPLARDRGGRVTGYLIPSIFGHGVAETEDDAAALISEMARRLPAESARFFCPLSEHNLFRRALSIGCRTLKVMTLMAMGPYDPPCEVWMPSILY